MCGGSESTPVVVPWRHVPTRRPRCAEDMAAGSGWLVEAVVSPPSFYMACPNYICTRDGARSWPPCSRRVEVEELDLIPFLFEISCAQ
jgi:hypothetical protein